MTDFKEENRKMLWNFNHSFLSLFQELIALGNFLLSCTVKKLSHRMDIFCWLCCYITLSHYKIDKNKEEKLFSAYKKLKIIFFYKFDKAWIRDPDPGSGSGIRVRIEILG